MSIVTEKGWFEPDAAAAGSEPVVDDPQAADTADSTTMAASQAIIFRNEILPNEIPWKRALRG
ncbi:hypothetical protein [Candidatus Protofrankia californiensis]|uniref:hypothetical protein n=1 Tax=Candidatus Protofrankia californiensis TaxID=1839754 RepID=UPI0013ED3C9E|nr:hypothetical protein [Candidatus Protofrankia californiensis]